MKLKIENSKLKISAKRAGMTLFMAVTIMSILLFITFAVVNITVKSSLFASSGKDSQLAFFAADAGIECALFWDAKSEKFATSTNGSPIICAGLSMFGDGTLAGSIAIYGTSTVTRIGGGGNANPTSVFGFPMAPGSESGPCTIVTVRKYYVGSTPKTYIKSRGYNTCVIGGSRRIERGIEVMY